MWLWLFACGVDRQLVDVPVAFDAAPATFDVGDVSVTLDVAEATVADLRFEGPAVFVFRLMPVAHAHPGHDFAGDVGGEMLGTYTIDLLATEDLGTARCYEGDYATGRFDLLPDPVVRLEGTATTASGTRAFAFDIAIDEEISGVAMEGVVDPEVPTRIHWSFDPAHALSFVDWTTPSAGVLTTADGLLMNTVPFGVTSATSWTLSLEEP